MTKPSHEYICIRCPRGCEVSFNLDEAGKIQDLSGNFCKLGETYVTNELTDPRRTLTTLVKVRNGVSPLVPVWTEEPVPKDRVMELADLLRNITLDAPVKIGQVVLEDPLGVGVSVVASGNVQMQAD